MDPATERNNTQSILQDATTQLEQSVNKQLIPPEGISFGFAIRGARDTRGVAAVNGGIKYRERGRAAAGPCVFDTDEPVVRIILTIMKFDPVVRCAALLQFSERAIGIFENDLFLECASLDANTANLGISTMDWGIASCCKEGVPDVIFRRGASAAESRIVLLGERPADVANNIIICSNRI
ncbi:MAG: phosphomethylpyrimidine kinase [Methanoregulaceae archaeon]|nr:MAG: phosphomethylpyrimidine kinase [Methanoregulaceae archaeon]